MEQALEDPSGDPAVEARPRAIEERAVETVEATVGECGDGADGAASRQKEATHHTVTFLPSTRYHQRCIFILSL